MKTDGKSSVADSAATSGKTPDVRSRSEAEFLADEMRATRAALQNAAGDLQSSLKSAADIRLWTRKFPWAAVGVAVATGFVAASVVKPAQAASPATPHPTPDPQQDSRPAAAGSLIGTLLRRAADMALQAVVAAATQPSVATDGDEEQPAGFDHNGQTEPAATGSEFSP